MVLADIYKIIADLINSAQDRGSEITYNIENMNTILSNSEILSSSIDRQRVESQIDVTLDVMINRHQIYTTYITDFVSKLQKYIEDNYYPINDFLSYNNIKVLSIFADISETVGYHIDTANIENIS